MSQVDSKTLHHIAQLSMLSINPANTSKTLNQFTDIMTLVEQLSLVDTSDTSPMANPHDLCQPLRLDQSELVKGREDFQAIAPEISNHHYLVPQVISEDSDA